MAITSIRLILVFLLSLALFVTGCGDDGGAPPTPPSFNFDDDVPDILKKERADIIMDLQSGISYDLNQNRVGQELKVLFDKTEGGYFVGRTEFDSPEVDNEVLVSTKDQYVRMGDFARVLIDKADHYDLYGSLLPLNK